MPVLCVLCMCIMCTNFYSPSGFVFDFFFFLKVFYVALNCLGTCSVDQAGLKLKRLLPLPPKYCHYHT